MNDMLEMSSLARIDRMRSKLSKIRRIAWLMVGAFVVIGIAMVVAGICLSVKALSYASIAPFALMLAVIVGYVVYEARTEEQIKEIVFNEITSGRR